VSKAVALRRSSAEFPQEKLVKLGIEVAQSTVSIYMMPWEDWPLQTWKAFVRNHGGDRVV
jgi:hypothetical protein